MPKYYVESGRVRLVLTADHAEQAAVKAFQWSCDRQAEVYSEPAGDLGLVAALSSAYLDRPLPRQAVFFGEVGLSGEIRAISRAEDRVREAAKLGFARAYAPKRQVKALGKVKGLEVVGVSTLEGFVEALWD